MQGIVTITTDISYCPKLKRAAYAIRFSRNVNPLKFTGMLKDTFNGPAAAELACIALAVWRLDIEQDKPARVVINTDSQPSIDLIENGSRKHDPLVIRAVHMIKGIHERNGWKLDIRHVRAHVKGTAVENRHRANQWCDDTARETLANFRIKNKRKKR